MKSLYPAYRGCLLFAILIISQHSNSQSIGTFPYVAPSAQTAALVLPTTHTFQRIIRSGDALTAGGTLATNPDFTGYVPIAGSSRNGYLSISGENTVASVAVMTVTYSNSTHIWSKSNSGNVTFPVAALQTQSRFCSGTVTPNGTIMVSEESLTAGDGNGDGYQDVGWIIEIDPATRTVMESDATHAGVDKLWAIGRQTRENVRIAADNQTLYTGADDPTNGFVYKFVATTPGNFSSGQLFVLVTTAGLGTGTWAPIANTTQANKNGTVALSTAAGAYNFNGVEDIEISPVDGKVYFTAKGPGRIYRFTDNGATVSNLQVFVENTSYDVDPGAPVVMEPWGIGNDNLAFDGEGKLWVLQDGDRNHIWVVGPTHSAAVPDVRIFGKTPAGSEPTGITFTPDFRFMFISIQHPNAGNATAQTDAAGVSVTFNTPSTLVIARRENLGPTATLAIRYSTFTAKAVANNAVELNWSVEDSHNHDYFSIERSENGADFTEIYRNTAPVADGILSSFSYTDAQQTNAKVLYYRIKQCSKDGACTYSEVRQVRFGNKEMMKLYPSPASTFVKLNYTASAASNISISIIDAGGTIAQRETRKVFAGDNQLQLSLQQLKPGTYTVMINDGGNKLHQKLIKL